MSQKQKRAKTIKVVNPPIGGRSHYRESRARAIIEAGDGHYDHMNRLVLINPAKFMRATDQRSSLPVTVTAGFSGDDSRDGMPVLPPSPEVLARMAHRPGRLLESACV